MMRIEELFASNRDVHRAIEKVISYGADQESRLKAEIQEYIVTESIEDELHDILEKMDRAMESGSSHEIGVWVSGFYGSGKSSFTKYLGLALDKNITIEGEPFLTYLSDRCQRPQTKALLKKVATAYPATVVFLSLDSESLAGAEMRNVSTTIFYKALERAGYSKNIRVAQLERKLKRESKLDEYQRYMEDLAGGVSYKEIQDDELTLNALAPKAACHFYPKLFSSDSSFTTDTVDEIRFSDDEANEMIEILRERFGNEHLVFIVDEVGQYVGAQTDLILNLQGLAQNLKRIGDGKVWIFGTGQQTLLEDDESAALNSPELYKLKDRFPIAINLRANDIKEICYRRLLSKSPEGSSELNDLYAKYGPGLQHNTKLEDAGIYETKLTEEMFKQLYPFLPSHFDILLNLLSQLAKSTSGIGLRSAIKVIQDVLVHRHHDAPSAAEREIGWLANAETFFNAMEEDIKHAFQEQYNAYKNIAIRRPNETLHASVGKAILVLQILKNMPATAKNITALIHDNVAGESRLSEVQTVLDDLVQDQYIPVGEEHGNYKFRSEKLNEIEQERAELVLRKNDTSRIFNHALSEVFSPLPKARVSDARTESMGLKSRLDGQTTSITGDRNEVQLVVMLSGDAHYESARDVLVQESTQNDSENKLFLIGHNTEAIQKATHEIQRSKLIFEKHKNTADSEVKAYCNAQDDLARKHEEELKRLLHSAFYGGSVIFRGNQQSCTNSGTTLENALSAVLKDAVTRIYDKHDLAPVRAQERVAEQFLLKDIQVIGSENDPLGLLTGTGTDRKITSDHPALIAIKEHLAPRNGVDGQALTQFFAKPPYGWSPDTVRYLVAALFKNSEVKFKAGGQETTQPGDLAVNCIKSNTKFKQTTVSPRTTQTDMAVLSRASRRLTELTGKAVPPFEDSFIKEAKSYLLECQTRFTDLPNTLEKLACPGSTELRTLASKITELLETDASDAVNEFGCESSDLYDLITLANSFTNAFQDDLPTTLEDLIKFERTLNGLGSTEVIDALRNDLSETLSLVHQARSTLDFYKPEQKTTFNTALTTLKSAAAHAVKDSIEHQAEDLSARQRDLQATLGWTELNGEEQTTELAKIVGLKDDSFAPTIQGLQDAQSHTLHIQSQIRAIENSIRSLGDTRRHSRLQTEREEAKQQGEAQKRTIRLPQNLADRAALKSLIQDLEQLHADLAICPDIDIHLEKEEG